MNENKIEKVISKAKDQKGDASKKQIAAVKKALKSLRKRKNNLKSELDSAKSSKAQKHLKDALKINKAHRNKAVRFLQKNKN